MYVTDVSFKLQDYREPSPDSSNSPKEWMIFHPRNFDEDLDLELLKAPFTFPKDQLALFITTLRDQLANPGQDNASEEEDN